MPPESFSFDFSTQAQKNPTEGGVNTSLVFSLSFSLFFGRRRRFAPLRLAREEGKADAQNAAPQLAQCAGRAQTKRRCAAGPGRGAKGRARRAWGRLTGPPAIRPGAERARLDRIFRLRRRGAPNGLEPFSPRPPGQALKRFVHKPLCYNPLAARGAGFQAPWANRRIVAGGGASGMAPSRGRAPARSPKKAAARPEKDGRGIPPNSAPGARSRVKHKSGACA